MVIFTTGARLWGVQNTTSACANALTPAPNTNISICPAGWRLPTGEATTGEFTLLNNAINDGSIYTDYGLRTYWLAQRGGNWSHGTFNYSINFGFYWSTWQYSLYAASYANVLELSGSGANPSKGGKSKNFGNYVRCLAI